MRREEGEGEEKVVVFKGRFPEHENTHFHVGRKVLPKEAAEFGLVLLDVLHDLRPYETVVVLVPEELIGEGAELGVRGREGEEDA